MKESIAQILKREGYIAEWTSKAKRMKKLKLKLKYQGRQRRDRRFAPRQHTRPAPLRGGLTEIPAFLAAWARDRLDAQGR